MRLTDLDPRWISKDGRYGMGLSFISPVSTARVVVWFKNPVDGGKPILNGNGRLLERTGDSFGNLTLSPSIESCGDWRGFVTCGTVVTA